MAGYPSNTIHKALAPTVKTIPAKTKYRRLTLATRNEAMTEPMAKPNTSWPQILPTSTSVKPAFLTRAVLSTGTLTMTEYPTSDMKRAIVIDRQPSNMMGLAAVLIGLFAITISRGFLIDSHSSKIKTDRFQYSDFRSQWRISVVKLPLTLIYHINAPWSQPEFLLLYLLQCFRWKIWLWVGRPFRPFGVDHQCGLLSQRSHAGFRLIGRQCPSLGPENRAYNCHSSNAGDARYLTSYRSRAQKGVL